MWRAIRCRRVVCGVVRECSEGAGPAGGSFVVSCGSTVNGEDQQRYLVTGRIRTVVQGVLDSKYRRDKESSVQDVEEIVSVQGIVKAPGRS